jgi:hypothetical protein
MLNDAEAAPGDSMQSGRIEHRMAVNLAGLLERSELPICSEVVSIENISNHGARVATHRHWRPHDHVVLMELTGDFHTDAEVIYCQRLRDDAYVVGLRFARAAAEMLTRNRGPTSN